MLFLTVFSQKNPFEKRISIHLEKQSIGKILSVISKQTGLNFSFNSDIISVDSIISVNFDNKPIGKILSSILGKGYYLKSSGNHIILLKKEDKDFEKKQIEISGFITNTRTGEKIQRATIYEINTMESVLSDSNGYFNFKIDTESNQLGLGVSKENYSDTVIMRSLSDRKSFKISLSLLPSIEKIEKIPLQKVEISSLLNINPDNFIKSIVQEDMISHSDNIKIYEKRIGQVSLLPYVGTNRKLNGAVVNYLSLNLIAGYSNGVQGLELGTFLNINKVDVTGFQFSGIGNFTGGSTSGVQLAGLVNYNKKEVSGFQMSTISNLVYDTLKGIQLTGLVNYARVNKGFQLALLNFADSSSGISLGLISIINKGYYDLKIFADEMQMGSIIYSMGTQKFYNIFGISANDKAWTFSYGFGTYLYKIKWLYINSDLIFSQLSYNKFFETDNSIKTKLSVDFNVKIFKHLFITPEVSFNMYETDILNGSYLRKYVQSTVLTKVNDFNFKSVTIQYWSGFSLGLNYNF